jgi:hypothetical protein
MDDGVPHRTRVRIPAAMAPVSATREEGGPTVKFDAVPVEDDEFTLSRSTAPGTADGEPGDSPGSLAPDTRLRRTFEYARVRAGFDLGRVHGALNRMHHTIEVANARAAADTGPAPTAPLPSDVFRPEAFQARVRS